MHRGCVLHRTAFDHTLKHWEIYKIQQVEDFDDLFQLFGQPSQGNTFVTKHTPKTNRSEIWECHCFFYD